MSISYVSLAIMNHGNLHFGIYGSLGAFLLVRAADAVRQHRWDDARELAMIGALHIALGLI